MNAVVQQVKLKLVERQQRAAHHLILNAIQSQRSEEETLESPTAAPMTTVTYSVLELVRQNPQDNPSDVELKPLVAMSVEHH